MSGCRAGCCSNLSDCELTWFCILMWSDNLQNATFLITKKKICNLLQKTVSGFLNYARVLKIYTRIEPKKLIEDFDALVIQRALWLFIGWMSVEKKTVSKKKSLFTWDPYWNQAFNSDESFELLWLFQFKLEPRLVRPFSAANISSLIRGWSFFFSKLYYLIRNYGQIYHI